MRNPGATISELLQLDAGPPVDYSFKGLKTILDIISTSPTSGTTSKPPYTGDDPVKYVAELVGDHAPVELLPSFTLTPKSRQAQQDTSPAERVKAAGAPRYNANSVRLCNNALPSLSSLDRVMHHVLDEPSALIWLDVSYNHLTAVEDVLAKFPRLQVLYLHGNGITQLPDVEKLKPLGELKKLTLHGNPIAELPNYKLWVCAQLPQLKNLDFSAITKVERDKVATWHSIYCKKREE